jgi:hypothetical protein
VLPLHNIFSDSGRVFKSDIAHVVHQLRTHSVPSHRTERRYTEGGYVGGRVRNIGVGTHNAGEDCVVVLCTENDGTYQKRL